MVDYRNCTDDMFNRAMAMKNKDVDKIPTNYLCASGKSSSSGSSDHSRRGMLCRSDTGKS